MKFTMSKKEFKAVKMMLVEAGYELNEIMSEEGTAEKTGIKDIFEIGTTENTVDNKYIHFYVGKDGIDLDMNEDLVADITRNMLSPALVDLISGSYKIYKLFSPFKIKVKNVWETISKKFDFESLKKKINGMDEKDYADKKFEQIRMEDEAREHIEKIKKEKEKAAEEQFDKELKFKYEDNSYQFSDTAKKYAQKMGWENPEQAYLIYEKCMRKLDSETKKKEDERKEKKYKDEMKLKYEDPSYKISEDTKQYLKDKGRNIDTVFSVYKKSMDMQKKENEDKRIHSLEELEDLCDYRDVTDEEDER